MFAENVEKELLPVQSETRTLDQTTAGQSTVGATRRTVGRSTPARASCVPVRTPYRTRFRAYHGWNRSGSARGAPSSAGGHSRNGHSGSALVPNRAPGNPRVPAPRSGARDMGTGYEIAQFRRLISEFRSLSPYLPVSPIRLNNPKPSNRNLLHVQGTLCHCGRRSIFIGLTPIFPDAYKNASVPLFFGFPRRQVASSLSKSCKCDAKTPASGDHHSLSLHSSSSFRD